MSDDFLSRWSRRKRGDVPEPAAATPQIPVTDERDEAETLAQLGLKHPDDMAAGDDFGAFLRAAVPVHLKALAMRKLWRSNPTLACLDGLNDYDGDFTGTGIAPGRSVQTAYEVGRGIAQRLTEIAEVETQPDPLEDLPGAGQADEPEVDLCAAPASGAVESEAPETEPLGRTRRRMTFRT